MMSAKVTRAGSLSESTGLPISGGAELGCGSGRPDEIDAIACWDWPSFAGGRARYVHHDLAERAGGDRRGQRGEDTNSGRPGPRRQASDRVGGRR